MKRARDAVLSATADWDIPRIGRAVNGRER